MLGWLFWPAALDIKRVAPSSHTCIAFILGTSKIKINKNNRRRRAPAFARHRPSLTTTTTTKRVYFLLRVRDTRYRTIRFDTLLMFTTYKLAKMMTCIFKYDVIHLVFDLQLLLIIETSFIYFSWFTSVLRPLYCQLGSLTESSFTLVSPRIEVYRELWLIFNNRKKSRLACCHEREPEKLRAWWRKTFDFSNSSKFIKPRCIRSMPYPTLYVCVCLQHGCELVFARRAASNSDSGLYDIAERAISVLESLLLLLLVAAEAVDVYSRHRHRCCHRSELRSRPSERACRDSGGRIGGACVRRSESRVRLYPRLQASQFSAILTTERRCSRASCPSARCFLKLTRLKVSFLCHFSLSMHCVYVHTGRK
ncbi:unnamed protein product [Trichogramma brassicae]|uniref:Uncharacterized protein n=1 Tax=Trichogramma brassicae TaxID=86971 RepID=A0A6H5IX74_9HYME|nr:unnamed protein product [Trichogramma brassicae]